MPKGPRGEKRPRRRRWRPGSKSGYGRWKKWLRRSIPGRRRSAAKRWLELEMDQKSRDVFDAAERWLMAVQAKTVAGGEQRRDESEQAELDAAEVDLATAIMVWRNAGRPD